MDSRGRGRELAALERQIASGAMPTGSEAHTLEIDEAWASMRLAGSPLSRNEVDALARQGVALGGHALDAYIPVADYLAAARYAREAPIPTRRRGFLTVEEIVALHAHATRRSDPRPGALRTSTIRAYPGGVVPPPPWMLPQALAALAEHFRRGPGSAASPMLWAADAVARLDRMQPFASANGRVARLCLNLLLRRAGYAPLVVRPRDARAYVAALRAASTRDPFPLALLIARSLARSHTAAQLANARELRPLSEFAAGNERASLYKAAQRGTLQAFRRSGRLYTSDTWIAEYRRTARRSFKRQTPTAIETSA
jgi:hypothetical protein